MASPSVPLAPLDMLRDTARGCWDQLTRVEVGGVSALTFGAGQMVQRSGSGFTPRVAHAHQTPSHPPTFVSLAGRAWRGGAGVAFLPPRAQALLGAR